MTLNSYKHIYKHIKIYIYIYIYNIIYLTINNFIYNTIYIIKRNNKKKQYIYLNLLCEILINFY